VKKFIAILSIIVVLTISLSVYKYMSQKVKYEVINLDELPEQVQNEISMNSNSNGFSIHKAEKYTYVFYRANHTENEYVSTDLSAHKKNGKYIITASVDWAVDEGYISYDKAIKIKEVSKNDMILKEHDNR
jgi:hypothetical protein